MPDLLYDEMKKLYPSLSDDPDALTKIDDGSQANMSPDAAPPPDVPPSVPEDMKQLAIDQVRQKYLGDKYSDTARQAVVDQNKGPSIGTAISAGLAAFGSGLAGGNAAETGSNILKTDAATRANNIAQFDQGRTNQISDLNTSENLAKMDSARSAQDPNDPRNKRLQAMLQNTAIGKSLGDNLSKITVGDFPQLSKVIELENTNALRKDTADTKNLLLKSAIDQRANDKQDKEDKKSTEGQDRALQNTVQVLESARGNPAAAQAEKDMYNATKADSLAKLYGDPNKLSMPQVRQLVSEVGKIASGGVPAMSELEGLTPHTLQGKLSEVWSSLANHPTPANAGAFIKQYQDYNHALTKDAQEVIDDKYGRVIEANRKRLGDDNYQSLKSQYIDRFKNKAAANAQTQTEAPQTKIVGGVTYKKVPGGWMAE